MVYYFCLVFCARVSAVDETRSGLARAGKFGRGGAEMCDKKRAQALYVVGAWDGRSKGLLLKVISVVAVLGVTSRARGIHYILSACPAELILAGV